MSKFVSQNGIVHELKCVYTLQQNNIAKRKIRNLLDMTQTLLFQMKECLRHLLILDCKSHDCWNENSWTHCTLGDRSSSPREVGSLLQMGIMLLKLVLMARPVVSKPVAKVYT